MSCLHVHNRSILNKTKVSSKFEEVKRQFNRTNKNSSEHISDRLSVSSSSTNWKSCTMFLKAGIFHLMKTFENLSEINRRQVLYRYSPTISYCFIYNCALIESQIRTWGTDWILSNFLLSRVRSLQREMLHLPKKNYYD